jgi:hypothetical protein
VLLSLIPKQLEALREQSQKDPGRWSDIGTITTVRQHLREIYACLGGIEKDDELDEHIAELVTKS